MINLKIFQPTLEWIKDDLRENPTRFALEVFAWLMSIGCAIIMMLTVPTPPFLLVYPMFIVQCMIFGWASYTRKSFGMLSNYLLLVTIDTIALFRMLL
jgi:hypothetical protein